MRIVRKSVRSFLNFSSILVRVRKKEITAINRVQILLIFHAHEQEEMRDFRNRID